MLRTVKELLREVKTKMIPYCDEVEPAFLLSHCLSIPRSQLILSECVVTKEQEQALMMAVDKRLSGYPLQYILGEWEFYGLPFYVGEGVLIPRADTETLVERCLKQAGAKPVAVLDLCSGSGCIAIAIKKNLPNATVTAVEKSEQALEFLHRNIERNKCDVSVIKGDALDENLVTGKYDTIASNPPYISSEDMKTLQKEVQFEPQMALYGQSEDGLSFYRKLAKIYKDKLNDGGMLAFEIGINQQAEVAEILAGEGFKMICNDADLCGIIRVVYAIKM